MIDAMDGGEDDINILDHSFIENLTDDKDSHPANIISSHGTHDVLVKVDDFSNNNDEKT